MWWRRQIALKYGVPPFTVDEWPAVEVELEMRLWDLDGEAPKAKPKR